MPRSSNALQRDRNRSRRANLAHEIDGADVDAQLERRRGDHGLELSGLELLFGGQAQLARQAAVMREHRVFAEPLGEIVRHALGQPPRVDEDERRPMFVDERADAVVDFLPHLVRRDRPKLVLRHFDCQIHGAPMAVVDDGDLRLLVGREEPRDDLQSA